MLSPTDAAWSVLEEGHRVEKVFLPFAIPAAMAAYGGFRGGQNVKRNEISEPILGTAVAEGNDSLGSNLAEFGSGFAEGVVPVKGGGFLARRFGGRRAAKRAAARQAAEKEAAEAAARHQSLSTQRSAFEGMRRPTEAFPRRGQRLQSRAGANIPSSYVSPSQLGAERQAFNAAQARAARLTPRAPPAQSAPLTLGQRAKLVAATGAGAAAAYTPELMMALGMGPFSPTGTEFPDFGAGATGAAAGFGVGQGGQQGFQLAGQPSGGVGGVQNVGVSGMADKDIFQGKQFQSAPTSSNMQAPSIKQKGTAMSLGNNLIKSAVANMEFNIMKGTECKRCGKKISKMGCHCMKKADACKRCGKKGCVNKMHCMAKADDDGKKKKPAHGMVIVIGSKAGPGPSTNGKRDDKKDDKE